MEWSGLRTAGKTADHLGQQTVIINNTSPIMMNQDMAYQSTARTGQSAVNYNAGQGYGSPGNYGQPHQQYGSPGQNPQMQMNMNQTPQNMNAKISF